MKAKPLILFSEFTSFFISFSIERIAISDHFSFPSKCLKWFIALWMKSQHGLWQEARKTPLPLQVLNKSRAGWWNGAVLDGGRSITLILGEARLEDLAWSQVVVRLADSEFRSRVGETHPVTAGFPLFHADRTELALEKQSRRLPSEGERLAPEKKGENKLNMNSLLPKFTTQMSLHLLGG